MWRGARSAGARGVPPPRGRRAVSRGGAGRSRRGTECGIEARELFVVAAQRAERPARSEVPSTAPARRSRPDRAPLATSPGTRGFREPDGECRPVPAARGAAGHIEHRTPEIRPRPAPESSGDRREQDKPAERARPRTIRPELPSKERRDRTRADCEASSSRSRPAGPAARSLVSVLLSGGTARRSPATFTGQSLRRRIRVEERVAGRDANARG